MARPRLAPDVRRSYRLEVYLSTTEVDALYRLALRNGQDLSAYVRGQLITLARSEGHKTPTPSVARRRALP